MANAGFTFTFEFPPHRGLPADALGDALKGVQDALRRTVEHLGDRQPQHGRPPGWITLQSALRVPGVRSDSLIFDLELAPPPSQQLYLDKYGPAAIDELLRWDGEEGSTLPLPVTDRLYEIREQFSEDVKLWLGNANNRHRVELKAKGARAGGTNEPFDKEAFLNNPNPTVFDPDKIVRASEPFDVDEFMRYIHDLRDDGAE